MASRTNPGFVRHLEKPEFLDFRDIFVPGLGFLEKWVFAERPGNILEF